MIIKGEEKTDEEIIMYVNDYVKLIESVKEDRFHDTVRTIPEVDRLSGLKALDYGCGWGRLSISLRDKGYIVDGIDLFQNEIDIPNQV